MDEAETKICTNCKREIPAVNFTIHTVHCARNIKMCPVCKEPFPQSELQMHHEKMHKLLPCSKCGERVCGTDLEDHVRDSCAHTIQTCRYCSLELPRRELPAHEGYCGVRTEQCPECREWVMIKYRQLHVDSNHGFVRLAEDPPPQPKKEVPKSTRIPKATNNPLPATSNGPWALAAPGPSTNGYLKNINLERPRSEAAGPARLKRTNDQPQINTHVAAADKLSKDLGISRGAVKKRQAPQPPALPNPDPRRDMPYYSAVQRQQREERLRQEQTAANLAQGLPPVLSPAAKLDRLRKMDALHSRETEPAARPPAAGRLYAPDLGLEPGLDAGRRLRDPDDGPPQDRRDEFKNLKPMTPEEFMQRFTALQLRRDGGGVGGEGGGARAARPNGGGSNDRFSEIKSSLRELRRGLNEVTAPYNANSFNNEPAIERNSRPIAVEAASSSSSGSEDEVRLPCEFCQRLVPVDDLVIHQTGCRPDLAQFKPRDSPQRPRRNKHRQQQQQQQQQQQHNSYAHQPPHPDDLPVIPCEFCTESLPVYLIQEHQERCRRDGNMLYAD